MSSGGTEQPERVCPELLSPVDLGLGIILIGGIVLSYAPQLVKIGMRKSHVGLSLTRLVLATMCSSSNLIFYVILENYDAFYCCTSTLTCFSNMLSFVQSVIIVLCDLATILLAYYYFDEQWLTKHKFDTPKLAREANIIVGILVGFQALIVFLFIIFAFGPGFYSYPSFIYGQILVGFSSIGTICVFIPQIYATYKLKHIGSLSLPTIFLQGFGAIILTYFSAVQNPWYIFVPYALSSFFTIILFIEGVYYVRQDKKAGDGSDPTADADHSRHPKVSDEDKPLLNAAE